MVRDDVSNTIDTLHLLPIQSVLDAFSKNMGSETLLTTKSFNS